MRSSTRIAGQRKADLTARSERAPSHVSIRERAEPGGLAARFALVVSVVTARC
jgi:hypothetical protein